MTTPEHADGTEVAVNPVEPAGAGEAGGSGGIWRKLAGAGILLAVLALMLYAGARTGAFRDLVVRRLEKRIGMDVTAEQVSLVWPWTLVIDRVSTAEYRPGQTAGFGAREIRVTPRAGRPARIEVLRGELTLVRGADRLWTPASFGRLGDLPMRNLAEVSKMTREFRGGLDLRITDGAITWLDSDGRELAVARGISLDVAPVAVPGDVMGYHRLVVYTMIGVEGVRVHDVEREWMWAGENDYVELKRSGQPVPAPSRAFWEMGDDER